jgi:putative membrane-bound dehydrogenase-like protein
MIYASVKLFLLGVVFIRTRPNFFTLSQKPHMISKSLRLAVLQGTAIALTVSCMASEKGLSPEEALKSFELADGFSIELLAAEPLIADPVAMEIDERGRLYVVEMPGYPLDKSFSGKIRMVVDEDGDGKLDKSTVFAEGLRFPNGILRWKQGVLVTDAPDLIYLEDTDGDGRADKREVVLTGFALSNPQHIVNSPMLGLDNWIYLANEPATVSRIYVEEFGDTGSSIRFPGRQGPSLPPNANGRRVRLRPDTHQLEAMSSNTQFGHTSDPWGRHFLVSNSRHIYHEVIQSRYLDRNPALLIPSAVADIAIHGSAAEVYPITEKPEHQMLTSSGVFTSACGNAFYQGGLFPAPFDRVSFVAEPVGNLVHAEIVEEKGASFSARRLYEGKEFLASRDAWFRPVNHYIGPDGALYVIDYYRRIIEHPEWMAQEVVESPAIRHGIGQGRIYRIIPKGGPSASWTKGMDLGKASDGELVESLGHSNIWHRRTSQRLLLDRRESRSKEEEEVLVDLLSQKVGNSTQPLGRLHAGWVLSELKALTPEMLAKLLQDETAGVRENAILLAENLLPEHETLLDALLPLFEDTNDRVVFQLLCTLGGSKRPDVVKARNNVLFSARGADPWMQAAVLSAGEQDYAELVKACIGASQTAPERYHPLLERLVTMWSRTGTVKDIDTLLLWATEGGDWPAGAWQNSLLMGLAKGNAAALKDPSLAPRREALLQIVAGDESTGRRNAALGFLDRSGMPTSAALASAIEKAAAILSDRQASLENRTIMIRFHRLAAPESSHKLLLDLLHPAEPIAIQKAALGALGEEAGDALIARWTSLTDAIRADAVSTLMATNANRGKLIAALEKGDISSSYINANQQVILIARSDIPTRNRLRKVFSSESKDAERNKVIERYKKELSRPGDAVRGREIYQKHCAACHQIAKKDGTALGPDLTSIRIRPADSILSDILDPNRSIADGYALWQLTIKGGSQKVGVIASETTTSITLRAMGQPEETIARETISDIKDLGLSLMPPGLENVIPPQEMVDLLFFIKNPD